MLNDVYIHCQTGQMIELIKTLRRISPELGLRECKEIVEMVGEAVGNIYKGTGIKLSDYMEILMIARGLFMHNEVHKAIDMVAHPCSREVSNAVLILLHNYFAGQGYTYEEN